MTPAEFKEATRYKKIKDYSSEELDAAVEYARNHCVQGQGGMREYRLDFFTLLNGIDAYMERRRRSEGEKMAQASIEKPAAIATTTTIQRPGVPPRGKR